MNELSELLLGIRDGQILVLEKGKTYHVRQDDSFELDGYYCSNTAKIDENPTGRRYTAIYLKGKKGITIEGNGATVLVHGKMTPILLDRCQDITFKNLTIDYACPTMAEIAVQDCVDGVYTMKINPECRFRLEYLREADIRGNQFDAPYLVKTRCVGSVCDESNRIEGCVSD